MEQKLPIIAKKIRTLVRIAYLMLKKGISRSKLLADLNAVMKRSKIAGKVAIHNLVFHHHHSEPPLTPLNESEDSEFSCTTSPANPNFRHPSDADLVLAAAMEIMNSQVAASSAIPEFRRTPTVKQLRITDSPQGVEEDADVDDAAEVFISKFYRDLMLQKSPS